MNKRIERITALALFLVCGAIVWSQLDAYSHAQSSSGGGVAYAGGPTAPCATIRAINTSVAAGSAGTSVDSGATGTTYWTAVSNHSRTFDIEVGGISSGTFRISPGGSYTASKHGAATPDAATIATNCAGCGGAATYVSVVSCDDN